MSLPSFSIEIVPFQAKTPKPGEPEGFTQEMYDQWLLDADHQRFEARCDAGQIWFWAAKIREFDGQETKVVEVHDNPFDVAHNTGYSQLKNFTKELMKVLTKRAKDSLGDDEKRIIIGPHG